jgi:UDP-glucose 4-epimerase
MKILVTGGAGFIGSSLIRGLISEFPTAQILVLDNLATGKEENLTEVRDKIQFHLVDIRNLEEIQPLFSGVDVVFHLAAIPSVPRSIHDPIPSHHTNINGTFNVLLSAKENAVKKVICASSSSVYGDGKVLPKSENHELDPKSPYGAQKLVLELYCKVFKKAFGMETLAVRFFNVFGPRQDPHSPYSGVISLFIKSVLSGVAPTIFGDGEHTRDFTYVDNVVQFLILASKSDSFAEYAYNCACGGRQSLNLTWDILRQKENSALVVSYGPAREGDILHLSLIHI